MIRFPRFKLKHLFKQKELFSEISGNEDIKWTLQKAIENEEAVHILLVVPPGLGKTRFLKAIEKEYPDLAYFALASGSTGAGMINHCFENAPRFLLVDEIEDMRQSDQATLLSLLQDGCLVVAITQIGNNFGYLHGLHFSAWYYFYHAIY